MCAYGRAIPLPLLDVLEAAKICHSPHLRRNKLAHPVDGGQLGGKNSAQVARHKKLPKAQASIQLDVFIFVVLVVVVVIVEPVGADLSEAIRALKNSDTRLDGGNCALPTERQGTAVKRFRLNLFKPVRLNIIRMQPRQHLVTPGQKGSPN